MIHARNTLGIAVAVCGERGLGLKFSIATKLITCPDCIKRREASAEIRTAKLKAMHATRR